MSKLADGTRIGDQEAWRQWALYRSQQGKSPFLEGKGREGRKRDEDDLLEFVVFLAKVLDRKEEPQLYSSKKG